MLTFFDPSKKTKISTDSSKNGIGAVLLQSDKEDWRPVAYASRTMTTAECRYAQIEKECLGLVYGFEKFHSYVYGLPTFVAETDHKPLVAIIKKNLSEMTPRIQRLMMKLQRYDFQLVYTPEMALLQSMSATYVITHMKSVFARHGIPQIVYSDNGPCYSCREFQSFAEEYDFQLVTSSPLYAQSNGKAEKGVHIVKQLLKKAKDSNSGPYLA
ncbi:hypothetical protein L3Q82_004511 [Scortum barcoo]|uniref:Uncharacterized protein n=1 Tax=Scortum barcoo TaxID=214431 RepID=A0ACB8VHI9_9TELE|nr:hypothetical protein L3Q82_004511 [Scortum barcoo]